MEEVLVVSVSVYDAILEGVNIKENSLFAVLVSRDLFCSPLSPVRLVYGKAKERRWAAWRGMELLTSARRKGGLEGKNPFRVHSLKGLPSFKGPTF